MQSHEIVGYAADGEIYCARCALDTSSPVFAGEESFDEDSCPGCRDEKGDDEPAGARVCCAYRAQHAGTVLAPHDPLAWRGSLKFLGPELPDADEVRRHVAKCREQGLLADGRVPVLWDFGAVYWDSQLSPAPASKRRPTFSTGHTPREVIYLYARVHCIRGVFPARLVGRDEVRAAAAAGILLDGGGNCRVPVDDLVDALARLHAIDDSPEGQYDDELREAAQQLRSSILDCIGIEEV